jgi:hypothetical protein
MGIVLTSAWVRSAGALELQQQLVAPRLWYVDWNFGGIDLGEAPLLMLNYNAEYKNWHFQILGGYGEGWESDPISDDFISAQGGDPSKRVRSKAEADRIDIQWQLGRKISLKPIEDKFNLPIPLGPVYVGVAYHYVEFNFDAPLGDAEYYYHSPELLLGLSQSLGIPGVYFRGHITYMPLVNWTTDAPDIPPPTGGQHDGETDGLLYDVGLVYQVQDGPPLHVSAGYRALEVSEEDEFDEDEFKGFYAEVGMHW